MSAIDRMTLEHLLTETALRWRLNGEACPECHGALYTHQALGPIGMGYHRCPACRLNFVQRDAIMKMDRLADALLDRAAQVTPLISHPVRAVASLDRETTPQHSLDHDPPTGD